MMKLTLNAGPARPAPVAHSAALDDSPAGAHLSLGGSDLMGNRLASYFSQLFDPPWPPAPWDRSRSLEKRKEKKKKKCPKAAAGRETRALSAVDAASVAPFPEVSLARTPSAFAVFAAVRATCLLNQQRQAALLQLESAYAWKEASGARPSVEDGDTSDASPDEASLAPLHLPKIIAIGLHGVFEIIRESRVSVPIICQKALASLLDIIQGLQPEELAREPPLIMAAMFDTLMDLAGAAQDGRADPRPVAGLEPRGRDIRSLACACLLSFAVALGDTGRLLRATATMLMSPQGHDKIVMPGILVSLQRSVLSVMLGSQCHPNFLNAGVPQTALLDAFTVNFGPSVPSLVYSIASDGSFHYLHTSQGLYRVGSGYGGTVKGRVYLHQPDFEARPGWLLLAQGWLFFKLKSHEPEEADHSEVEDDFKYEIFKVDCDSLTVKDVVTVKDASFEAAPHVLFADGTHLGVVSLTSHDHFVVKLLGVSSDPMTCIQEVPLKLARKSVTVFGASAFEEGSSEHRLAFNSAEDVADIQSGKEFSLLLSTQGKVYYTGKSSAMGHKQNGPPGQWQELTVSRASRITQIAMGHDGQHALILSEDGAVYFTGTAKRGEDGDQTKNRRQPKSFKPKRIDRMEGTNVIQVASNNGTSALVGKEGELYVFGKDSNHADYSSGLVGELKGVPVTKVVLGKAHVVVLTKSGEVYTFGMNNKGQCGRDFQSGPKEGITAAAAANNAFNNATAIGAAGAGCAPSSVISNEVDDTTSDPDVESEPARADLFSICPRDQHKWKHDQCMVCVVCGECTGYGSSCVSSGRPDRNAGMLCGCGSGDSGCSECGVCRTCSGEDMVLGGAAAPDLNDLAEARAAEGLMDDFLRVRELSQFLEMNYMQGAEFKDFNVPSLHHNDLRRLKLFRRQNQKMLGGGRRNRRYAERDKKDPQGRGDEMGVLKAADSKNKDLHNPNSSAGASDVEKEAGKLASLSPAKIVLASGVKIVQISSGLHHTLLLSNGGEVFVFGSNTHGQLGLRDLIPRGKPVKLPIVSKVTQIAAGGYHSVLLTESGEVLTFGLHQKGQLARSEPRPKDGAGAVSADALVSHELWYARPDLVAQIGPKHGCTATWVGASDYQTFIKIDESLINAKNLLSSTVLANDRHLLIVPTQGDQLANFHCLAINKAEGLSRSFDGQDQECFKDTCLSFDPVYQTLWSYYHETNTMQCYVPAMQHRKEKATSAPEGVPVTASIMSPELAVPLSPGNLVSRNHASLNLLSCLDTLTQSPEITLSAEDESSSRMTSLKSANKDDFLAVNRFDSHGGGWGYSGHSIEAIRFMCDTDILLGGYGLFGGRGEYIGKIKLFDIGQEGGELEMDGELMAETEEITYECGSRQKYPILFDEPIPVQGGRWYIAWARVSGPSSDCGSSGQSQVTTEDHIQFTFKSSKKSNNGTDVNAGQVPQLLYKVVTNESQPSGHKLEFPDPITILSGKFARSVSPECFESLLGLIQWSWNAFKAELCELLEADDDASQAIILDLERLMFICRACLRLLVTYTHEVYPARIVANGGQRPVPESQKLAESVYETRNLLQSILVESLPILTKATRGGGGTTCQSQLKKCQKMANLLLSDAHGAFVASFHAFFPTGYLKWACLCNLLASIDEPAKPGITYDRLLAAVLDSLCSPFVKLRNTFPITYSPESETRCKNLSPSDNLSLTASMIQAGDSQSHRFPILNELMSYQSHVEGVKFASWSFREVLDRLLCIVSLPVKQMLKGEPIGFSKQLEEKSCQVISAVIAELANQTITNESEIQGLGGRTLYTSPTRFTRTSNTRMWNTGNGSPDAICFSVDKSGIFIVGCCVYGGSGSYTYELELLDDQTGNDKELGTASLRHAQSQRWHSLEIAQGIYSSDDGLAEADVVDIKFERAVPIRANVKYALRLRNQGGRTNNGDGGVSSAKGPDGTNFTFSSCSLSFNGTNPTRGQLPQILYYSSPQGINDVQSSTKSMAELYSRRTALSMTSTIVRTVNNLLVTARDAIDERGLEILNSAPVITKLMPHVFASITGMVKSDPQSAVQVLSFIQDMLPSVAALNALDGVQSSQQQIPPLSGISVSLASESQPTAHYAWLESEHPYKFATVSNNRVAFPKSVQWMSIEFDPRCATSQAEDILQIYIRNPTMPVVQGHEAKAPCNENKMGPIGTQSVTSLPSPVNANESQAWIHHQKYISVLKKFSGTTGWPRQAVILPGNEVMFSLETASDYVKDDKTSQFGYRCLVVGYEAMSQLENGLHNLELELSYLGGLCSAALMQKNIPLASSSDDTEDMHVIEETAIDAYEMHPTILSKGFALTHPPTVHQALDGVIPFNYHSHERTFLKNFVHCAAGTSGGRLARWLQPESYVDVELCQVLLDPNEMKCSWPTIITIITQDQYGEVVHVPNMRVQVKAIPIDDMNQSGSKVRKITAPDATTFGGMRPPNLEHKYEVTVKDKMFYHAITIQKCYDNYSFEELRFASPKLQRQSENMLVRANNNGTYSANWTPGNVGLYRIHVIVDGCEMSEQFKVEVQEPPKGMVPPPKGIGPRKSGTSDESIDCRLRKFVAKPSAGLRIRVHPTLQSEQIGIVPVDGTVAIIDELHNSDGIWVRLSSETLGEMAPQHPEGWCLQYNQHLEKTLMIPVANVANAAATDPGSREFPTGFAVPGHFDSPISETVPHGFPSADISDAMNLRNSHLELRKDVTRGPGQYTVMKCGASGHNLRSHPSLLASPVGRLGHGAVVLVEEVKRERSGGEVWVRLDPVSSLKYCFTPGTDGESPWALAVSSTDVQYLESEAEMEEKRLLSSFGGPRLAIGMESTNMEFSIPSRVSGLAGPQSGIFSQAPSVKPRPQGAVSRRRSEAASNRDPMVPSEQAQGEGYRAGESYSQDRPIPTPRHSLSSFPAERYRPTSSPGSPRRTPSPNNDSRKPSFFQKFFRVEGGRRGPSASPPLTRKTSFPVNKDIPPELQGVSVKELVKVIGESRANGNGVTPPGTPKSRRKLQSRSASPHLATSVGRSSSPTPILTGPQGPLANPALSKSPLPKSLQSGEAVTHTGGARSGPPSECNSFVGEDGSPKPSVPAGQPQKSGREQEMGQPASVTHPKQTYRGNSMDSVEGGGLNTVNQLDVDGPPPSIMTSSISGGAASALLRSSFSVDTSARSPKSEAPEFEVNHDSDNLLLPTYSATRAKKRVQSGKPSLPSSDGHSPSTSTHLHQKPPVMTKGPIKHAMSPSVAESIRAVFAAFVWHEGIVHDTMAVASFLKFHPALKKEDYPMALPTPPSSTSSRQTIPPQSEPQNSNHPEQKPRQRHSVEVLSTSYMKAKSQGSSAPGGVDQSAINANTNRNITILLQHALIPEVPALQTLPALTKAETPNSHLPPTLSLLVALWEDIRSYCQHVILQQIILTTPLNPPMGPGRLSSGSRIGKVDRKERKSASARSMSSLATKRNKKRMNNEEYNNLSFIEPRSMSEVGGIPGQQQPQHAQEAGETQPESASNRGLKLPEKETFFQLCEMCEQYFQHPVTYHMKTAHPGCGSPAGGKGYNSGGSYYGGWAGNCGDGGVGGSSWYLICEKCREQNMKKVLNLPLNPPPVPPSALNWKELSIPLNGTDLGGGSSQLNMVNIQAKAKMKPMPTKLSSPSGQVQSHIIMNNNAMFLLDLASASNSNLRPKPLALDAVLRKTVESSPQISLSSVAIGGARSKVPPPPNNHQSQMRPSRSELSPLDPNPFPMVPFQCFSALGVQDSLLKSLNNELLNQEEVMSNTPTEKVLPKESGQSQGKPFKSQSGRLFKLLRTSSEAGATEHDDQAGGAHQISPPAQFQTSAAEGDQSNHSSLPPLLVSENCQPPAKKPFLRSVSAGGNRNASAPLPGCSNAIDAPILDTTEDQFPSEEIRDSVSVHLRKSSHAQDEQNRKRNSTCGSDPCSMTSSNSIGVDHQPPGSSSDFLSRPSQALLRLFASAGGGKNMVDVLQRPVMSFVLQWNDLESLQVAMTLALRKAACRTYAMQALTWLLRSVSQPACLHDLLWCFISALESTNDLPPPTNEAKVLNGGGSPLLPHDEKVGKDKKNRRNVALAGSPSKAAKVPVALVPASPLGAKPKDSLLGRSTNSPGGPSAHLTSSLCEHPTSDIFIGGDAIQPLPETFHNVLRTISDLMMVLPNGSPLQQIAIRCWGIKFKPTDHPFLHQSHIFPTISRILSRPQDHHNEAIKRPSKMAPSALVLEQIADISSQVEIKVSSRQTMIGSLCDNSTETFWESGDDDRSKTKWITISVPGEAGGFASVLRNISIHVDNGRDLANKVTSVTVKAGRTLNDLWTVKQSEVEHRFAGWISCFMDNPEVSLVKIELKGPDNTLRVRQVRVLGCRSTGNDPINHHSRGGPRHQRGASSRKFNVNPSAGGQSNHSEPREEMSVIQKQNCEAETLRIFRLLTGQVFGRLLGDLNPSHPSQHNASGLHEPLDEGFLPSDAYSFGTLSEPEMPPPDNIVMFTASKLTHLQRQVCAHLVLAIKRETEKFRALWERSLCSAGKTPPLGEAHHPSGFQDSYCFEMLSIILALSGSLVGRNHLATQEGLIQDALSLLHTGSLRIQKLVIRLIRTLMPRLMPEQLAKILNVDSLPPKDFESLMSTSRMTDSTPDLGADLAKPGILDVFLGCIAKSLTLQVKTKGGNKESGGMGVVGGCGVLGVKNLTTVSLASCIHPRGENIGDRWWLRGSMSKKLAEEIVLLVKQMSQGHLGHEWTLITKSAVAENILNLTRLPESHRESSECLKYPVIWLALASLCVLDKDHVEGLTSGEYSAVGDNSPRPTCENHDDGETLSIISCDHCGNLCGDCDRFLHLHRRTKAHQRQVFKEEEDAIKVDLHEGCGRAKLFWVMALADSLTLKAMVEFREGSRGNCGTSAGAGSLGRGGGPMSNFATCRFCARVSSSDSPVIDSLCTDKECVEFSHLACQKTLPCGHFCGGIWDESQCLPCLHGCSGEKLRQDADDMCMICFTEALSPVPSILLECGHVFHYHCCSTVLEKRWVGPRISFGFRNCPICKAKMVHDALGEHLEPIEHLYDDVKRKALMRLEYDGLTQSEGVARFQNDPTAYAINRYAYYVCFKCRKAYFGGEAQCDAEAGVGDDYNPEELVCGGCSDVSQAQMCPKHGTDFLEYKCRYCCSVAVFFCFGTTHFCNACHDDFSRVANIPKSALPQCPVGPKSTKLSLEECPLHVKHPPTGEEFALGCGLCRNAHTF
eukprot:maker-scaffold697_size109876-snap-gene-0.24 protein:Tk05847 transcript:maker-scaffold697_size109876-snap-gene-0.24-mRNA-1 annotation:"e3 ubiquitin-protein ligase mycbp2 isoform x1"